MARSINNVILLGNVTHDPVLRYTKSGKPVCDFGIATNSTYTDEKGQLHETAQYHHIVAWGNRAEIAGKYLAKGRKVYVEGTLATRSYETTDGLKKSRTEIIIDELVILDGKGNVQETHQDPAEPRASTADPDTLPVNPDEIPF